MRIDLLQLNPTVGDLANNVEQLLAAAAAAKARGAQLCVAPELAVCGYPPRDLLASKGFVGDCLAALGRLIAQAPMPMLVGAVVGDAADPTAGGDRLHNGAVLCQDGRVLAVHRKLLLPNYDVFDESRYFAPGDAATVCPFLGERLGVSICEDIWNDATYWGKQTYAIDPIAASVAAGASVLVNLSASPYHRDKATARLQMLQATARRHRRPLFYVNQVGGNDTLVFDGGSLALQPDGEVATCLPSFVTAHGGATLADGRLLAAPGASTPVTTGEAAVEAAVCLGIRDYMRKVGARGVLLGLSGGVDSALVATLAVRALGKKQVMGVAMPSRYSSAGSLTDAHALAHNLGIRCDTVSIEPLFAAACDSLAAAFAGTEAGVAEENLQARARGMLLMAYSNKFNMLVLSTGNKSEVAVGYCTLYGDMCGGLSPISDLFKTDVYRLCAHLNAAITPPPIPRSTLNKPPSAELRPEQQDSDSLPPYPLLDAILRAHLEQGQGPHELVEQGFGPDVVQKIVRLVQSSEYKRRQMPPGLRLSTKAFGEGRRLPVAQAYRP